MKRTPLTQLDLNLLVALDRLLAHRSVTLAARDLGLSQPATSRALGRLRDALGDELLERVGREMLPTQRALDLEEPVRVAIEAARAVFEPTPVFDPTTAGGELVFAMGDEAQISLGDAVFDALARRAPNVDLRVRALSPNTVTEGRRGQIDLAIAPDLSELPDRAGAVDLSDFVLQPLYTRHFGLVVPRALADQAWTLDRFCEASHVIVSFEAGGRGFVDDLLAPLGRERRVAASVTNFPAAVRLVASTDLVGTIPSEIVASLGTGVALVPHPLPMPSMQMWLVWHPRTTRDPRHRFLRQVVHDAIVERASAWPDPAA